MQDINLKFPAEGQELTFGQKAVGLNFNPSQDPEVAKAKLLMAAAIDQMNDFRENGSWNFGNDLSEVVLPVPSTPGQKRHASTAITQLEDAQMRIVKALTWKD